jgi:hypothetical protein
MSFCQRPKIIRDEFDGATRPASYELIHTVTGLEREANHSLLLYFVVQTSKLDMASINKAHLLFEHGLLIKSIQYEQGTL